MLPDVRFYSYDAPNSISAVSPPETPLGELAALLAVFKGGHTSKWREKEEGGRRREGESEGEREGKERRGEGEGTEGEGKGFAGTCFLRACLRQTVHTQRASLH